MISGHDRQIQLLTSQLMRDKFSHAYLFVGTQDSGKSKVAKEFARSLLCEKRPKSSALPACGLCKSCKLLVVGTHPDFLNVVGKETPNGKLSLGISESRKLKEWAQSTAFLGRKVAIVDDISFLTREAANALLKLLEEPSGEKILILLASQQERVLPTIRSRVWEIKFWASLGKQQYDILDIFIASVAKRMVFAGKLAEDHAQSVKFLTNAENALASKLEDSVASPGSIPKTLKKVQEARMLLENTPVNARLVLESLFL
jgi:DNA polymerase III delta prime subunit